MNRNGWILVAVLVGGCAALGTGVQRIDALGEQVADRSTLPALAAEPAPPPSPRTPVPAGGDLAARISSYFDGNLGHRLYLQVDKPLYKPGETIWFKTWDLAARNLSGTARGQTLLALISPKGSIVLQKRLNMAAGTASNDFELPADTLGGEYTLRATSADGQKTERSIIVSAYEAPRMKKKLEFVNKSYGPGDTVSATLEIRQPTGEPLAGKSLTAIVTIDGIELPKVSTTTNSDGAALLKFDLPKTITAGDGLLTVLVEDGAFENPLPNPFPSCSTRCRWRSTRKAGKWWPACLPASISKPRRHSANPPTWKACCRMIWAPPLAASPATKMVWVASPSRRPAGAATTCRSVARKA